MKLVLFLTVASLLLCLQACEPSGPEDTPNQLEVSLPEPVLAEAKKIHITLHNGSTVTSIYKGSPKPSDENYLYSFELKEASYTMHIVQLAGQSDTLYNETFECIYQGSQFSILPKIRAITNPVELSKGETHFPKVRFFPKNTSYPLTLVSNDSTVAAVAGDTKIKAMGAGTATVVLTASSGTFLLRDTLTVIVDGGGSSDTGGTVTSPNRVSITSPGSDTVVNVNPYSITYLLNGTSIDESITLVEGANTVRIPQNTPDSITPAIINIVLDQVAPRSPKVIVPNQTSDRRPIFNWVSTSIDDGIGYFRHRLGPTKEWVYTQETSYQPEDDLDLGTYTLTVQERDAAFNWSEGGEGKVILDEGAPKPSKAPEFNKELTPIHTNNRLPTWVWSSSEGGNLFKYRLLPSKNWVDETNTQFTPSNPLPEGPATLEIKGQNANGAWSAVVAHTIEIDTTKPVLMLKGVTPDSVLLNEDYADSGAFAKEEPELLDSIGITGEVDVAKVGTYPITYQLTDLAGNVATELTREVVVFEKFVVTVATQEGATLKKGEGENTLVSGQNLDIEVELLEGFEFIRWEVSEGLTLSDPTTPSASLTNISAGGTVTALTRIVGPTIITELTDQAIKVGGSATFEVEASGSSLSYEWFVSEKEQGVIGPSFTLEGVTGEMNNKQVKVVVSNTTGQVQSVATLVVAVPPKITKQPEPVVKNLWDNHTFTVEVEGDGLNYQWKKDGGKIFEKGTSASYTLESIEKGDAGQYSVEISNASGTILSTIVSLDVQLSDIEGLWISPRQNKDGILDLGWVNTSGDLQAKFLVQASANKEYNGAWDVGTTEAGVTQIAIDDKLTPGETYYIRVQATLEGMEPSNWLEGSAKALWECEKNTIYIEGVNYNTISIDETCWIKENLQPERESSLCPNKSNCETQGRLYNFETASTLCPDGWELPGLEQFNALADIDAADLRIEAWGGTNSTGFSASGSGIRSSEQFQGVDEYAAYWSKDGDNALKIPKGGSAEVVQDFGKSNGLSVRCVRISP